MPSGAYRIQVFPQVDRSVLWVALSALGSRGRDLLVVVKPETVVAWHRAGGSIRS